MTSLALTHIGGPTVLIELAGWRILTDPTFDPPGGRYKFGWGTASTKTAGPSLTVEEVGRVDAVLLTHDHHADNLDTIGRQVLADVPIVVTTEAGAQRLGGGVRGLGEWGTTRLEAPDRPTIDITATPCRHGPPLSRPITGDVIGFALDSAALPDGAVWISGDTVLYDGVRGVGDHVDVDVALLHVGGVRFPITGPLHYTMTIDDAVRLCELLRPNLAIPVHYEGWSHFREARSAFDDTVRDHDGPVPIVLLRHGQRTTREELHAGLV